MKKFIIAQGEETNVVFLDVIEGFTLTSDDVICAAIQGLDDMQDLGTWESPYAAIVLAKLLDWIATGTEPCFDMRNVFDTKEWQHGESMLQLVKEIMNNEAKRSRFADSIGLLAGAQEDLVWNEVYKCLATEQGIRRLQNAVASIR